MDKLLIVVDMQNDFIDGSLGTKEAENIVDNVVKKIETFEGDIICTLDTHSDDYLDTQEGKNLPVKHCIKNTDGWKINSKVKDALEKKSNSVEYIEKINSFGSLSLGKLLAVKKYKEITLIGLCTDICVISNAIIARSSYPESLITIDSSCCAGVTPQSHQNALDAMKICQINIV